MSKLILHIALTLSLLSASTVFGQAPEKIRLNEGVKAYQKGEYLNALTKFELAIAYNKEYTQAYYNAANAAYRIGNFKKADLYYSAYIELLETDQDKAKALYNLGNAYLKEYEKKEHTHEKKNNLDKLKKSIASYRESLRYNPNDEETRYNLSYAMSKLPPPSPETDKDQQQKEQEKKDDQKNDQKEQQQKEEDKKKEQEKREKKREEEEKKREQEKKQRQEEKKDQENSENKEKQDKDQGDKGDKENGKSEQEKKDQAQQEQERRNKEKQDQQNKGQEGDQNKDKKEGQDQSDQNKENDQNKDGEKSDQNKDDQNKGEESDKNDDQNKEGQNGNEQDQDQQKNGDNKDQNSNPSGNPKDQNEQQIEGKVSKGQMLKDLDAINNDEQKTLLRLNRHKGKNKQTNSDKDW